ncbi:general secretion pathway protein GspK [Tateyamaria armeniaca]|uniref:General secretion pathway protein GspK n=1 Tax=Tateyamaria armeniaca TaxID=2518930 RepID=A0ABW8UW32_9RHOB
MIRHQQAGVSLLNVLAVLAVGTGLVHVMLRDQDVALERLAQYSDLAQARALALGGPTSVAVALRRDFDEAPQTDHPGEAWAWSAQDRIALGSATYKVSIQDVRGKFDLNALQPAALVEQRVFAGLLSALNLPQALGQRITQIVAQNGPLAAPDSLLRFGMAPGDVARLAPHVATVSTRGTLNLNTVSEPLLAALLRNGAAARGLVGRRSAKGFLDNSDLAALGIALPPLAGFTSDIFDVTTVSEVGEARAVIKRRLLRDPETGTVQSVALP